MGECIEHRLPISWVIVLCLWQKCNSRMFWSVWQDFAWPHSSFPMGLSPVWCLDFQSFFLPCKSLRGFQIVTLFQVWGHTPLANVWLVSAEASCWGLTAPDKSLLDPQWWRGRKICTNSGRLLTCIDWRHIIDVSWQLSKSFMLSCWMSVHLMNSYQHQLTSWQCQVPYLYLYLSFYLSLCLSPTLDLLLWPFWNTWWIRNICQYLSLTVGPTLRISVNIIHCLCVKQAILGWLHLHALVINSLGWGPLPDFVLNTCVTRQILPSYLSQEILLLEDKSVKELLGSSLIKTNFLLINAHFKHPPPMLLCPPTQRCYRKLSETPTDFPL